MSVNTVAILVSVVNDAWQGVATMTLQFPASRGVSLKRGKVRTWFQFYLVCWCIKITRTIWAILLGQYFQTAGHPSSLVRLAQRNTLSYAFLHCLLSPEWIRENKTRHGGIQTNDVFWIGQIRYLQIDINNKQTRRKLAQIVAIEKLTRKATWEQIVWKTRLKI